MNFMGVLNGLFEGVEVDSLRDVQTILVELGKAVKTEEDLVQYAQIKYLLEVGNENFVYALLSSYKQTNNLLEKLDQIVSTFDKHQIAPQNYAYFLYCVLNSLKIKTDEMIWVNPFDNKLTNQMEGIYKTFGSGLFKELIYDFDILNNTLRNYNNKRAYVTIPDGVSSVEDGVFSNDQLLEFVTIPQSLTTLSNDMLSGCANLRNVVMTSGVKVIPQNFAKGSKNLSLIVAENVKEIKAGAFDGTSIGDITYLGGKKLEIIGTEAFANCANLQTIDISEITEVHPLAFAGCYNITEVVLTLSSNVLSNDYKFHSFFESSRVNLKNYQHLTKIKIIVPSGEIPESFFEDCVNVQEIEVIGEIKKIGERAFKNCQNLKTLKMNLKTNTIKQETFFGCKSLVELPTFETVEFIENSSFRECSSILNLEFKLIKELGKNVFQDCSSLEEINFDYKGDLLPEYSFSGCSSIKKYDFLSKVKRIGAYALAKMVFDQSFEIPASITGIQTYAFDGCFFGGVLTIPKGCKINTAAFSNINMITAIIYNNLEISDLNNVIILPHMIFEERLDVFNQNFKDLVNLKINTDKIEDGAFRGWTNIQRVVMDGGFSTIPTSCFENCTNLMGIKVNAEKFIIKANAFANCTNFSKLKTNQTSIEFENDNIVDLSSAIKVETNAFNRCFGIEQVCVNVKTQDVEENFKLHKMFEEIKVDMEGKYERFHTAIINLETAVVPDYFFDGCQNIANVKIIGEFKELSEGFFRDCAKLENLEMQYLGTQIPKECFKNCVSLKKLSTFQHVEQIGEEAFINCRSLEGIKVECGVKSLGRAAFENCTSMRKVDMVYKGELLKERTFLNCNNVMSFRFLNEITKIERYALSNITFTEDFAVPHKLQYIESYAFANSTFLDTLMLPAAKIIDNLAFTNVIGFDKIEFKNLVVLNAQKVEILPYKMFCDTLEEFNSKYKTVDTVIIKTDIICDDAFKSWQYIKNVSIAHTVKSLPNSCFEGCASLEKIQLPYYDIALGNRVFTNCSNLVDVSFTDLQTEVESNNFVPLGTYHNCTKLQSISISIDQTVLSSGLKLYSFFEDNIGAFVSKYPNLSSVTIRSGVKEIPESFFEGCVNIEKINILDDIDTLNKNAFAHCINLQELKLKFNGEVIPSSCFLSCERLANISHLKAVKIIEERAFEKCLSLTAIQFNTPIETLGAKAFDNCKNLEKINMYFIGEFLPALAFGSCEALLVSPRLLKLVFADNSAFEGCINLDSVYINALEGANFTNIFSSSKRITTINFSSAHIPARFFNNLRNVEEIIFEKRILSIGDGAFEGVKGMQTIKGIEYAESIGDYAFAHSEIEFIKITSRTKYIGVGVFAGCENLKQIEMPIRCLYAGVLFDSLNHNSKKRVTQVKHNTSKEFLIPEALEFITVNDGILNPGVFSGMDIDIFMDYDVKAIPDYTFAGCKRIKFAKPQLVEKIGAYAFSNSNLAELVFDGVKEIGEFAFTNSRMPALSIGDKLTKIANTALQDSHIESLNVAQTESFLTFNEMLVDIKRGVISHVNNVSGEITVPDQVHTIESNTFVNCAKITKVHTNNVHTIQTDAFINCENLTTLFLEKNLKNCEPAIVRECYKIRELFLSFLGKDRKTPKGVEYLFASLNEGSTFDNITINDGLISTEALKYVSEVQVLDLEKNPTKVLEAGLLKDTKINTFVIPGGVAEIQPFAFDNSYIDKIENKGNKFVLVNEGAVYCQNKLIYVHIATSEKLNIPLNITEVYEGAFQICNTINHLDVYNENMIINKAFNNINHLEVLTIGDTPIKISEMFANCVNVIKVINYKGRQMRPGCLFGISSLTELNFNNIETIAANSIVNKDDLNKVSIGTINIQESLKTLDVNFLRNCEVDFINIIKNKAYSTIKNMVIDNAAGSLIYSSNQLPTNVTIDFNLRSIGSRAFENRSKLQSIDIGATLEVHDEAFVNCDSLKDVVINNTCAIIGKDIVKKCNSLLNISVPFIGQSKDKLDKITYLLENDRTTMINNLTITNQEVIDATFAYSKNILKVVLGDVTTTIKANSFNSCIDLREIEIPRSVKTVDKFAFIDCKKRLVAHVYSKSHADSWDMDWKKINDNKLFSTIKVSYVHVEGR